MGKLTSGLEDYIEEIYIAYMNQTPLKGAELARKMKISRASVSEALAKLIDKQLITYSRYEAISLTEAGICVAKEVWEKHHAIASFFETILGVDKFEASENACKIEHIISENVLNKMIDFTEFYKSNQEIFEKFKKE